MQRFIARVFNTTIFIFTVVFLVAFIYTLVYGGIVPPSTDHRGFKENNFDAPLLYFSSTDRDRAYEHTVLFNKDLVKDSNGCLQVDYTTSKKRNVGVKTKAYETRDLRYIAFMARANKPIILDVGIGCASNPDVLFISKVQITTEWETYKVPIDTFKPVDFAGKTDLSKLRKDDFSSYIEFSVPKSEYEDTGIFWIDKLSLGLNRH